jgi:hypothetical protein
LRLSVLINAWAVCTYTASYYLDEIGRRIA